MKLEFRQVRCSNETGASQLMCKISSIKIRF